MIRFLISSTYFAAVVGGLGWAETPKTDEAPAPTELALRIPDRVDDQRVVTRAGDLQLVTYAALRNTCESFDGYEYEVEGGQILIDSYVEIRKNRFCAEVYRDGLRRDYRIKGLDPRATYRIFFRDDRGEWVDYGVTQM